ncbi:8685_t:CDS:1 [Ambispora leptoticha]|uniref:8685_t:CDS:1 n=1 Tax=Ambispora leptoticha TaxID=144679 RepID=A0A9N9FY36_9GLOM|nr:8685_t:CDS:1 [Ambispora leptoticha]
MIKHINLFFVFAAVFASIFASVNGAIVAKRDPYEVDAAVEFNHNAPNCEIDGQVLFSQFEDDYVRISGLFWGGFYWLDPGSYRFQIWTEKNTGGILEVKLNPGFYVYGNGGTSQFELYSSDITLDNIGYPDAEDVSGLWLRIYHDTILLCSARINIQ